MSASQLPLDLGFKPSLEAEDFLVAGCNEQAVGWIEKWPDWGAPALLIQGEEASGKTHLACLWAARSGARYIDMGRDPLPDTAIERGPFVLEGLDRVVGDRLVEEALFHVYSAATPVTGLLFTSRQPPQALPFAVADLASRLRAIPSASIRPPDDDLIGMLLVKQFADRQLHPEAELIHYLLPRIERSYVAIRTIVAELDRASLSGRRPVTIALARQVLEAQQAEFWPER